MRVHGVVVGAVMLAALAGCRSRPAAVAPGRPAYDGPLLTVERLVAELSGRAAPVRTLWARHDYVVSFPEPLRNRPGESRTRTLDGDGVLLVRKPPPGSPASTPTELRLQGSKDVLGTVFDLGSNRERAWLILYGDIDTMYWTSAAADAWGDHTGHEAEPDVETTSEGSEPSATPMPVRPELLADVLGLSDWNTDLTRYPTPVLRYEGVEDAYVLTMVEPAPTGLHLVGRREFWVDRATLRIRRVVLRGSDGREVVRSDLSGYALLELARSEAATPGKEAGSAERPTTAAWVARDISVVFPQSGTTMRLVLRSVASRRGALPSDASFRFPDPPPVSRVIHVR